MDFYITDAKSGMRALVKAGHNSKVIPLIDENVLVNTTHRNREVSSTLSKWLEERNLSPEAHMIRLEEGYFSTIKNFFVKQLYYQLLLKCPAFVVLLFL